MMAISTPDSAALTIKYHIAPLPVPQPTGFAIASL
jgi:hypothetical protein